MGSLLASVLPLALGAAISPTLLALQLLVLAGETKRIARGWALAFGAALVLVGFIVVCATALTRIAPHRVHHSTTGAIVFFVAAALLLGLAVRSQLRRPTSGEQHHSKLAQRLGSASTGWFVGAGALGMVANFSTLVLVVPAVHLIKESDVGTAARLIATAMLVAVTLLPVVLPVLAVTVLGRRVDPALGAAHRWVARSSRSIGVAIELIFAVYLVAKGIGELP